MAAEKIEPVRGTERKHLINMDKFGDQRKVAVGTDPDAIGINNLNIPTSRYHAWADFRKPAFTLCFGTTFDPIGQRTDFDPMEMTKLFLGLATLTPLGDQG